MFRGKITSLPGHIQSVYVQNGLKLFAFIIKDKINEEGQGHNEKVIDLAKKLSDKFEAFLHSSDLEVQERASSALQLLGVLISILEEGQSISGDEIKVFFAGELNPVGPKAQKKVPVPEGLDLDAWINEPPPSESSEEESEEEFLDKKNYHVFVEESPKAKSKKSSKKVDEPTEEELKKQREARVLERSMNPNYLKDVKPSTPKIETEPESDASSIPVQTIDLGVPIIIPGLASAEQYMNMSRDSSVHGEKDKKKKKKKKRKRKQSDATAQSTDEDEGVPQVVVVRKNLDMPEGAKMSDEDEDEENLPHDDPHRALADVSLDDLEYKEPYKPQKVDHSAYGDSHIPDTLFGAKSEGAKKKKKKKKEEEKEEEVEEKSEKKKKKKKKKHKEEVEEGGDLIKNGDEDEEKVKKHKKKSKKKDKKESKSQESKGPPDTDDMEFWLSNNDIAAK